MQKDLYTHDQLGEMRTSLVGLVSMVLLYPTWAPMAHFLFPSAQDGFGERLLVSLPSIVLISAYLVRRLLPHSVQQRLPAILGGGLVCQAYLVTAHFMYLMSLNHLHHIYSIGLFVVLSACIALLNGPVSLIGYSVLVMPLATWVSSAGEGYFQLYYVASVATALLINTLGTWSRIQSLKTEQWARKKIAQQQEQLLITSRLAAVGEMSGGIAHEINTPLTTIQMSNVMLGEIIDRLAPEDSVAGQEARRLTQTIDQTVKKSSMIVRGLLAFSRTGDYEQSLPYSLRDLVQESLLLCEARIKSEQVTLRLDIADSIRVTSGRNAFGQALLNIVHNAIDATAGLESRQLTLAATQQGEWVELFVEDNGRGIPKEIAKRVFAPFFTTKSASKGLGLGLSIAKALLEKYGGELRFEGIDPGTRMIIKLASAADDAQGKAA